MTSMTLLRRVGDERQLARTHDRGAQLPLMHGACAGDAARQNLRALGDERHQQLDVLVVDVVDLVRAELADLAAAEHRTALAVLPLLPALAARLAASAAADASLAAAHLFHLRQHGAGHQAAFRHRLPFEAPGRGIALEWKAMPE